MSARRANGASSRETLDGGGGSMNCKRQYRLANSDVGIDTRKLANKNDLLADRVTGAEEEDVVTVASAVVCMASARNTGGDSCIMSSVEL